MKFAKVMFLHSSVSHSVHRGVHQQVHPLGQVHPPGQVHTQVGTPGRYTPQAGTPPGRYTPQADTPSQQVHLHGRYTPSGQVHPLGRYTPRQVHSTAGTPSWAGTSPWAGTPARQVHPLPLQCMLGYGQQAGGTHPTGMHSYFYVCFKIKKFCKMLTSLQ